MGVLLLGSTIDTMPCQSATLTLHQLRPLELDFSRRSGSIATGRSCFSDDLLDLVVHCCRGEPPCDLSLFCREARPASGCSVSSSKNLPYDSLLRRERHGRRCNPDPSLTARHPRGQTRSTLPRCCPLQPTDWICLWRTDHRLTTPRGLAHERSAGRLLGLHRWGLGALTQWMRLAVATTNCAIAGQIPRLLQTLAVVVLSPLAHVDAARLDVLNTHSLHDRVAAQWRSLAHLTKSCRPCHARRVHRRGTGNLHASRSGHVSLDATDESLATMINRQRRCSSSVAHALADTHEDFLSTTVEALDGTLDARLDRTHRALDARPDRVMHRVLSAKRQTVVSRSVNQSTSDLSSSAYQSNCCFAR